ncbi:Fibrocystin-L [Manis pentadactyla]|nr:Fibrocystin-L [Manis pentadactyla]
MYIQPSKHSQKYSKKQNPKSTITIIREKEITNDRIKFVRTAKIGRIRSNGGIKAVQGFEAQVLKVSKAGTFLRAQHNADQKRMWISPRVVSSEKGKSASGTDLRITLPYGHQLFGALESSSSRARKFPGSGAS